MEAKASNQPRISVVICTWNRAEILEDCIRGLLENDFPNDQYELVVVDDGSTDHTGTAVRAFQKGSDPFGKEKTHVKVRYLPFEHRGLNAARNSGVKNSRGEVVLFVDDDEIVPPDYLKRLWILLIENPEASGVGGPVRDRGGARLRTCRRCSLASSGKGKERGYVPRLLGGNMALRVESFKDVGLFDPEISGRGDEGEWFHRARNLRFLYDPDLWAWHRRDNLTLLGLCRHSFVQGLSIPVSRKKRGGAFAPSIIRIVRLLAHAATHMCAQGLSLAMREFGACTQYFRMMGGGGHPRA